jgi:hypothetical protein
MKIEQFKPKKSHNLKALGLWVGAFGLIGVATLLLTRAATPLPSWQNINPGFSLATPYNGQDNYGAQIIEAAPSDPSIVIVGSNYQGLWKTTNAGTSWTKLGTGSNGGSPGCNTLDGRNWALAIDPTNPNIIFTANGYGCLPGLWKSTNGGASWTQGIPQSVMDQASNDVYSIDIDPNDHLHMLVGFHSGWANRTQDAGVIETKDGGNTWILHPAAGSWGGDGMYIHFLGNANTWLLATQSNGQWRTTDAGAHWTKVLDDPMPHGMHGVYQSTVTGWWYTSGHSIWRSKDGGATWTSVVTSSCNDGLGAIIGDGTRLYMAPANTGGTSCPGGKSYYVSALETNDTSWSQYNSQGFDDGPMSMTFDPIKKIIYSSNWRGGVWKLDVSGNVTPPPTDTTAPTVNVTAPANNTTVSTGSVTATATATDNVGVTKVEFYLGTSLQATTTSSPYTTSISTAGMAAGNYTIKATAYDAANNSSSSSVTITIPASTSTKFQTLPVGATLPTESDCSSRVKATPEVRPINATYNARKGTGGNYFHTRVSGNYTGTTDEIIQWAACKWGMDEDLLRAQAVQESYWFQNGLGDFTTDGNSCTPVYPITNYPSQYNGDPAHNGQCPESIGLLQVRWNYHQSAFFQDSNNTILTNNAVFSTSYNIDYYASIWRSCFDGEEGWLNTVERGETYVAGDADGCLGMWFAGRWKTDPANQYITAVKSNLTNRVWETTSFKNATSPNPIKQPSTPDTTNPTVSLTAPTTNASLTGTTSLTATASDAVGVTKVEFYIDSTLISTDTGSPYSASLNTGSYANGAHTVSAKAYDAANNTATSLVNITINNAVPDTTPPTVAISAPVAGATISGTLSFVQATASDNATVSKVEFYIDGALLGTDTTSPYSFSLNTTLYSNGSHTLTAKAYDNSNNTKTSTAVAVTVNNIPADTTPPSVIITAPLIDATISGSAYNISVNASDANGVTKVEISVDGVLKATDTSSPYSYTLDTTTLSNTLHSISAKAYDPATNSNTATVTVNVSNTAPPVPSVTDFNTDGHTDLKDLVILLQNYSKTVPAGTKGDCNKDGAVDLRDLIILLGNYGK